ncbi:MAG: hypothetical protein U0836_00190 [Pirellulales bacterium]
MAPRFSLGTLLVGVAAVAVATAVMLNANRWWSWIVASLLLLLIAWALLLALLRGRRDPFSLGFAAVGLLSLATCSVPIGLSGSGFLLAGSRSPTTAFLEAVCPFPTHLEEIPEAEEEIAAPGATMPDGDVQEELFPVDATDEAADSDPDSLTEEKESPVEKASSADPFPANLSLVYGPGQEIVPESPDRFRIEPFVEIGSSLFVLLFATLGGLAGQAIARRDKRREAADAAGAVTPAETRT